MANKMLIDATHPEETRVVVLRGNRVEEFDFESANRKQLRGNIYLAKVTRVEPSLQAAFVDYGGNRHGFLAFSEIHPDYYQIPVADRQALIEDDARQHRDDEAEHERRSGRHGRGRHRSRNAHRRDEAVRSEPRAAQAVQDTPHTEETLGGETQDVTAIPIGENMAGALPVPEHSTGLLPNDSGDAAAAHAQGEADDHGHDRSDHDRHDHEHTPEHQDHEAADDHEERNAGETYESAEAATPESSEPVAANGNEAMPAQENENGGEHPEEDVVESVGGADALEEAQERAPRVRPRQYKIQEVIKRRQVMLVQVVKEERGTKGAALTTYLSLAGRYSVLMPNTARGGGISRKITSAEDRGRLKEIAQDLEVPEGMGVILRTAGASRTKIEVKRDFEYLLRLWETVRDLTLKSTAPKLVYEEGSLTKRSIRDLYNKDIDEIIVAGDEGYKDAKEFMRMLMPSHAKNVKLYRDTQPVFTRFGIESQLDAMFSPTVQLRSGGYIVINQAEALVAIDVNSGRATREHHIEDTALKTNCEAAEEVARQLRLRDLAGLIVIDFIDMEEGRNNRTVERRLKEALRHDRARIQVGRISHFGLMEMSRQRIRTSVLESSTEKCPTCGGSGHVRSVSSVTLALLRAIEEMLIKGATHNLIVRTRAEVALYILNQKRGHLRSLEERFQVTITVNADPSVVGTQSFMVDRGEQVHTPEAARAIAAAQVGALPPIVEDEDDHYVEEGLEEGLEEDAGAEVESEPAPESEYASSEAEAKEAQEIEAGQGDDEPAHQGDADGDQQRRRRRRGGRGRGRGDSRGRGGEGRGPRDSGFVPEPAAQYAAPQDNPNAGEPAEDANQQPQMAGPMREGGEAANGAPRRRRRGRRGGRRNRQGRNDGRNSENGFAAQGDQGDQHLDQNGGPQQVEPDYDAPASASPATPAYVPPMDPPRAEPARTEATAESELPRRRSTVREAAPIGQGWSPPPAATPTPAAAPVVTSGSEEPAQPKRGWWGKRLLGGDD
ncbi:MAG: Rne/Rng family ribonuclease [Pseudolabrys sp.]